MFLPLTCHFCMITLLMVHLFSHWYHSPQPVMMVRSLPLGHLGMASLAERWRWCQGHGHLGTPNLMESITGWWFGTFFIFPYIGNNHPNWLIFFRGVQTTNQITVSVCAMQASGQRWSRQEWDDVLNCCQDQPACLDGSRGQMTCLEDWCFNNLYGGFLN